MADFNEAIPVILEHEGRYSNLRGDPGGFTAFGWSTAEVEKLGISLPRNAEEATVLFKNYFWNPFYDQIESQNVATKLFDDCVNQGQEAGVLHLQQALCKAGSIVTVDGIFGPATLTATNLAPEEILLPWMRFYQWQSYQHWIAGDSARIALQPGMANRAAWPDPGSISSQLLAGTYPEGVTA